MKKIDRNRMTLVSSEMEGELYSCFSPVEENNKPLVFVNDQITDMFHVGAFSYGLNRKVIPSDGIFQYDGTKHKPYLWVPKHAKYAGYDAHTAANYSKSIVIALEMNKLENVDIIGMGLGGVIGMYASVTKRVDNVIAAHPPILSAPIYDINLLKKYADTYRRKLILHALSVLTNEQYGYVEQNIEGYKDLARKTRPQKIRVVGSSIVGVPGLPKLDTLLADYLYDATGVQNDGIVLWDPEKIKKLGFRVEEDTNPTSHLKMIKSPDYAKDIYKRLILK